VTVLFSAIGKRGYMVDFFRKNLPKGSRCIGTSDRHSCDTEYTPAFFHCDEHYLLPHIADEKEYVDALVEVCQSESVDMLFSFYDFDGYILSRYLERFEKAGVRAVVSSPRVQAVCFDKIETYRFLKQNGFDTPWTLSADDFKLHNLSSYPVVVKPRFGFGSQKLNIAHSKEEVEFFLRYHEDEEMIVQQMLLGDEYSFDVLNDFDARYVAACLKRKMKMRSGETDQGFTEHNGEVLKWAEKLAQSLGHIGPLDVDLFLQDGKVYILEMNPRFGGGYPVTHFAGIDFTQLLIALQEGTLKPADYHRYREYRQGEAMIKGITLYHTVCALEDGPE